MWVLYAREYGWYSKAGFLQNSASGINGRNDTENDRKDENIKQDIIHKFLSMAYRAHIYFKLFFYLNHLWQL